MQIRNLGYSELNALLMSSFGVTGNERGLVILVDLPASGRDDSAGWLDRRRIAAEWYGELEGNISDLPFQRVSICSYPNVGMNNGDLPERMQVEKSASARGLTLNAGEISTGELLSTNSVILALTEFSATAPLKILAKELSFRGATLPGFSRQMIPALGLDYRKVDAKVRRISALLDRADSARIAFRAQGEMYQMVIDLRHRKAHVSGGLIKDPGTVANLPSGEAYIVPYEGEKEGDTSRTAGILPVQFGDEIVLFNVSENRARGLLSSGAVADLHAEKLRQEPAYGNIAELGIGVLGEWGVAPVGSTLLDEKLGPHIAFGRSDHFGGQTGPEQFSDRSRLVHIDWVYVKAIQPDVEVEAITLSFPGDADQTIVQRGSLLV